MQGLSTAAAAHDNSRFDALGKTVLEHPRLRVDKARANRLRERVSMHPPRAHTCDRARALAPRIPMLGVSHRSSRAAALLCCPSLHDVVVEDSCHVDLAHNNLIPYPFQILAHLCSLQFGNFQVLGQQLDGLLIRVLEHDICT